MLAASGQVHFMHQGHGHLGAHTRATNTESPPTGSRGARRKHETEVDTEAGMLSGVPESAVYVQIPVGSRNSASRNAYHTSLRPSSLFEPRHPSLKVVRKHSPFGGYRQRAREAQHTRGAHPRAKIADSRNVQVHNWRPRPHRPRPGRRWHPRVPPTARPQESSSR